MFLDFGEPNCWACGRYFAEQEDPCPIWGRDNAYDLTSGLDRCHLVAYAESGSSDPDNFVLLCEPCHQEMDRELPCNRDRALAVQWVTGWRHRWTAAVLAALGDRVEELETRITENPSAYYRALHTQPYRQRSAVATAAAMWAAVRQAETGLVEPTFPPR